MYAKVTFLIVLIVGLTYAQENASPGWPPFNPMKIIAQISGSAPAIVETVGPVAAKAAPLIAKLINPKAEPIVAALAPILKAAAEAIAKFLASLTGSSSCVSEGNPFKEHLTGFLKLKPC